MNILTTHKILGFQDKTQTFLINAKQSDTNRAISIQIADAFSFADFSKVSTAYLQYKHAHTGWENTCDISSSLNTENCSVTISLSHELLSAELLSHELLSHDGDVFCEIILKDKENKTLLTTNTFVIRVKKLGGDCI